MALDWHSLEKRERQGFCSAILAPVGEEYWFWWEEKGEVQCIIK